MTTPVTTPMPKAIEKILIQNVETRTYTSRPVTSLRPSSKAIKEALPMVKAGNRMCHAMTQANCSRDKITGSNSIG